MPQLHEMLQAARGRLDILLDLKEQGDAFDAQVDRFAEMALAGLGAAEALPLVEEHLSGCPICREEFEALMDVLRDAARAEQPWWRRLLSRK